MQNEQITSQSDDVQQETHSDEVKSALAAFDLLPNEPETVEEEELDQEEPEYQEETEEVPPATEEPTNVRKVKFNKGEVEVKEDEIDDLLQRGLALDKERERKETYRSGLERAAKLAGYDNVDTYLTELDNIERQTIQNKSNEINAMKQDMLQQYADAGFDPAQLEAFIDNHPLIKQAEEITAREQAALDAQKENQKEAALTQGFQDLFTKYPNLVEDVQDGQATWYTADMKAKIDRGYDPIDAYELINRDAIVAENRRLSEQAVLKQQRYNKRAPLSPDSLPDKDIVTVPTELSDAFALFGLPPKDAKKYIKK